MAKNKLPFHEWAIVSLFGLILLALAGYAWVRPKPGLDSISLAPLPPSSILLRVNVEGQVIKPGAYDMPRNATIKMLLEEVQPLPKADLSQLNRRKKLRDGQTIHIPERRPIIIHIKGAVKNPGKKEILSGTRYCELADQLEITPEADLNSIRRRKSYIQEGESIEIPAKKRKNKKSSWGKQKGKTAKS